MGRCVKPSGSRLEKYHIRVKKWIDHSPCKPLKMRHIIRVEIIKIHHKCEGRIEKSVPRITDWHHEACRVDCEGHIFLSHPHRNNGFFFLLTTYLISHFYWKKWKRRHVATRRAASVRLFVFNLALGLVRVCEIERNISSG